MATHRSTGIARNNHLVSVDFDELHAHPNEHVLQLLIGDWQRDGQIATTTIIYNGREPGFAGASDNAFQSHPYDQLLYMFSGELRVEVEGEEPFTMRPGDVLSYPAGLVHRNWVEGDDTAYLLVINIPKHES